MPWSMIQLCISLQCDILLTMSEVESGEMGVDLFAMVVQRRVI